jgi:hypothetical protein
LNDAEKSLRAPFSQPDWPAVLKIAEGMVVLQKPRSQPPMNFPRMSLSRILALPVLFLVSTVFAQNADSGVEVPPQIPQLR